MCVCGFWCLYGSLPKIPHRPAPTTPPAPSSPLSDLHLMLHQSRPPAVPHPFLDWVPLCWVGFPGNSPIGRFCGRDLLAECSQEKPERESEGSRVGLRNVPGKQVSSADPTGSSGAQIILQFLCFEVSGLAFYNIIPVCPWLLAPLGKGIVSQTSPGKS